MEFWSNRQSDDTNIRITIRLVGDMKRGDPHYIQFFNIIMRKCLVALKLELVGRDYFDQKNKVSIVFVSYNCLIFVNMNCLI